VHDTHWSFGDTGSLCYRYLPNVYILHYPTLKDLHSLTSLAISLEKVFYALGSCQSHCGSDMFSKILIFCFKIEFYNWQ
jgi:hypothetical protein